MSRSKSKSHNPIIEIRNEPAREAMLPNKLIAPDVPFSTRLKERMNSGSCLLKLPISEAHVSEFALARPYYKGN